VLSVHNLEVCSSILAKMYEIATGLLLSLLCLQFLWSFHISCKTQCLLSKGGRARSPRSRAPVTALATTVASLTGGGFTRPMNEIFKVIRSIIVVAGYF